MHYLRQCRRGRGIPLHPHALNAWCGLPLYPPRDLAWRSIRSTLRRSRGAAAAALSPPLRIAPPRISAMTGSAWCGTSRRKRGVLHSEIITPEGAPEWAQDRAELWNAAERAEDKSTRRSSATTGRDIILALPHELSDEQRLDAVRQFAASLVERYGVAVDFAIHAPDRHSDRPELSRASFDDDTASRRRTGSAPRPASSTITRPDRARSKRSGRRGNESVTGC